MQEQRDLIEQPLRRPGAFDDDRTRILHQRRFFVAGQIASGIDDDGRERTDIFTGHAFEQLMAVHVREFEVDDHAVEDRGTQQLEGLLAELHRGDLDIGVLDQPRDALALTGVVFDQQDTFDLLRQLLLEAAEHGLEVFTRRRFGRVADGAHLHRGFLSILHRHDVHRDVPGDGIFLEPFKHGQPGMVRQPHVQQDRIGSVLHRGVEAVVGVLRDQAAVLQLVGKIAKDAGELRLVLDHQHRALEREALAVVRQGRHALALLLYRSRRCSNGRHYGRWRCLDIDRRR